MAISSAYPLGPTSPYLRPFVICSVALTNNSFPRADIENPSTYNIHRQDIQHNNVISKHHATTYYKSTYSKLSEAKKMEHTCKCALTFQHLPKAIYLQKITSINNSTNNPCYLLIRYQQVRLLLVTRVLSIAARL